MSAALILEKLYQAGIQVALDGGDLVLNTDDISDEQITYLKSHKLELIAHLKKAMTQSLDEILATACHGLSITPTEIHTALAPGDIKDWHKGNLSIEALTAFAGSLVQQREMKKGKIPANYTKKAMCRHCGPVWLWIEGTVDGCPWCFHRTTGALIPRPLSIYGTACCEQQTEINGNHAAIDDSGQAGKNMENK